MEVKHSGHCLLIIPSEHKSFQKKKKKIRQKGIFFKWDFSAG